MSNLKKKKKKRNFAADSNTSFNFALINFSLSHHSFIHLSFIYVNNILLLPLHSDNAHTCSRLGALLTALAPLVPLMYSPPPQMNVTNVCKNERCNFFSSTAPTAIAIMILWLCFRYHCLQMLLLFVLLLSLLPIVNFKVVVTTSSSTSASPATSSSSS